MENPNLNDKPDATPALASAHGSALHATRNPQRGKYALIKTARMIQDNTGAVTLTQDSIDFGDDFFVLQLSDKYAGPALEAYGQAALQDDPEYSQEILRLAEMARNHPNKHKLD